MINKCFSEAVDTSKIPLVREKMARLNHIARLLNIETLDEVKEIWDESIMRSSQKLSIEEVRMVLLLRSDFDLEKVRALVIGS